MGLDGVELVMDLETAFNVSMDGVVLTTVGALYDWVRAHNAPDAGTPGRDPFAGELWERYLDVVERSTGIRRRDLRPEATFRELGLS
jgi:hypothetical protein